MLELKKPEVHLISMNGEPFKKNFIEILSLRVYGFAVFFSESYFQKSH
tara:strand:- start:232 stop:375 length:144 start_codon:yes stop_codon:yes gene_type:complete